MEHDMGNDAYKWKCGISKHVFLGQKYRDFVTKFIVCLPILSQSPLYDPLETQENHLVFLYFQEVPKINIDLIWINIVFCKC